MGRTGRKSPNELVENWPHQAADDHAAETARRFVVNLTAAIGHQSLRGVARDAGIDEGTIRAVLAGSVWPDLRTMALLEKAVGGGLYPRI